MAGGSEELLAPRQRLSCHAVEAMEGFVARQRLPAEEWIDDHPPAVALYAGQKMTRSVQPLDRQARVLAHRLVDQRQNDRQAAPRIEHGRKVAVERVVVPLEVAGESLLFEQH